MNLLGSFFAKIRVFTSFLFVVWICRPSKTTTKKYTAYDRYHGNVPYGKIPTKKEPIRTLGFTSRLSCHIINPNNSRAMTALTFLLSKLNTLQTNIVKVWVSRSHGVMTVEYWIDTTIMTSRRLLSHNPVSRGTNQPIRKSEFVQCIKFE